MQSRPGRYNTTRKRLDMCINRGTSMAGRLAVLAVLTLLSGVHGRNPGINVQLTTYGINYAASEFTKEGLADIVGSHLDDVRGSTDTGIGKVDYSLTELVINTALIGSTKITVPVPDIDAALSQATVDIQGVWHYKLHSFIPVSDGGDFDASLSQGGLEVKVQLGMKNAHPTVASTYCKANLPKIDINIHGGGISFLYQYLVDHFKDDIRSAAEEGLCKSIQSYIGNLNEQAQKLELVVPLSDELTVDLQLLSAPVLTNVAVTAQTMGEIFWKQNFTESPLQPPPLPTKGASNRMVNIWLSSYSFNTVGELAHDHGLIAANFSAKDLPDAQKYTLNTTCPGQICIGNMIPKLAQAYPNCSVLVNMTSVRAPVSEMSMGACSLSFLIRLNYSVLLPNNSQVHAFTTDNLITMQVTIGINNQKLQGSVDKFKGNVTLVNTDIGTISDGSLSYTFTMIGDNLFVPAVNKAGAKGVMLPFKRVVYVHPNITAVQDAFWISTDIIYMPKQEAPIPPAGVPGSKKMIYKAMGFQKYNDIL